MGEAQVSDWALLQGPSLPPGPECLVFLEWERVSQLPAWKPGSGHHAEQAVALRVTARLFATAGHWQ